MGLFFLVLAVLIGGTDAAITKRFATYALDPTSLVTVRFVVATLFLFPFALKDLPTLKALQRRDWIQVAFLAFAGTVMVNLLYFNALTYIPAFMTLMLYRTEPIFIILLSLLFWKQKASQKTWLLTTAAILCSALIAAGGMRSTQLTPQAPKGVALIMAAAVLFAAATLLGKELLARVTPILLIWLRMAIAAVTLLAIQTPTLLRVLPGLKTQDLIALILIGIVHSGLANWLFYKGLKSSSALFAGLVQLLGPVSGLTTGYLLLGEKPSLPQFAGILGLLAVLYLLAQPGQRIAMPVAPAPAQK